MDMQEETKYFIYDYESGWPYQVTKEQWERHHAIRQHFAEQMKRMCEDKQIGTAIIYGTAGEFENGKDAYEIFNNPPNYSDVNRNIGEETTRQGYFIPAYPKVDVFGSEIRD